MELSWDKIGDTFYNSLKLKELQLNREEIPALRPKPSVGMAKSGAKTFGREDNRNTNFVGVDPRVRLFH